jgi:hypothetical protein
MDKERSGTADRLIDEAGELSMADFLYSEPSMLSSLEANWVVSERLEEPDVDAVESEEDDACVGWPNRPAITG